MDNNFGFGTNDGRADGNETFADIPQNRTLIAEKLTKDAPITPEIVHGLQTLQQVFAHYKPQVAFDFTDAEGFIRKETLNFNDLDSFELSSIVNQSTFLREKTIAKDEYLKMIFQLNSNEKLKAALADPSGRGLLLDALKAMITELHNHNKPTE